MYASRKRARTSNASSNMLQIASYPSFRQSFRRSSMAHAETSDTSLYMDSGDCGCVCEYCNAFFWYEERCLSTSMAERPRYSQCCKFGRVKLPFFPSHSPSILELFRQSDFLTNIRAYNSMFSMTSFGAKIDETINRGSGPYVFKIEGQIHHWLGSLCPAANERPRFLQMYIYDTDNEISNRLHVFNQNSETQLSEHIVLLLSQELEKYNQLVKLFQTARDLIRSTDVPSFCVRLFNSCNTRCYDKPSNDSIGAIVNDSYTSSDGFDIVIRCKHTGPQRISKLHPLYMSLQYPLIFLHGESGWCPDMRLSGGTGSKDRKMTMNMFYSYQLHDRHNIYTLLLRAGRLLQQYLVDAYVCIEQSRLDYIRLNQSSFRTEFFQGIHDAVLRGDTEGRDVGKRTILPSSFTGGPRYMYKHYQDALAICRVHGNPQYFITFTCNVKWPEIERYMAQFPSLRAQDRPDIIARVFKIKVNSLLNFLKRNKPFGQVVADLYTIEFQKRGLPHCHLLLWVSSPDRIRNAEDIDKYISAEIPDPVLESQLYKVVSELMMHGPCGLARPNSPCMKKGSCSKSFPKEYEQRTSFDDNGYARYRRRSTVRSIIKSRVSLDNRYVVPYNRLLSLHYHAHINVEYCGWTMLIKYLFKYISKGADRVRYTITRTPASSGDASNAIPSQVDEIKNFLDGRFICPHEASWRILNFDIHSRNPPVQVLSVHLEHMQSISFKDNDNLNGVVRNPGAAKTTLTEWLRNNHYDESGRHLRYLDYLLEYRWDVGGKCWIRRSSSRTPAIGRLIYIHPTCGETFYLRMLLGQQRGCQTFEDIRTVAGMVSPTFRHACERLGLLGDDNEWSNVFNEAAAWASASELRTLFTHMLLYCEVTNPVELWNAQWQKMADDITHTHIIVNTTDLKQYVLYELELLLRSGTPASSLTEFGLPVPEETLLSCLRNTLLMEEKNYDRQRLAADHQASLGRLNNKQTEIYEYITATLASNSQALVFVYGHGGTGKTFLWNTIISGLRSNGRIVLAVAASGIASLLLPSGRTAHSRFKIPLDLTDESTCHVKKNTQLAHLLTETSLIIWDEAPMNDRRCFESLDRTLQDLLNNTKQPFGGKSIVLGGDFRQTLPIKPKCTISVIVASSLPRSYLWNKFKLFNLTENMRLQRSNMSQEQITEITLFSSWLLAIGDGTLGRIDVNEPQNTKLVEIPSSYIIPFNDNALSDLIKFIYDDQTLQNPTAMTLSKKAIVCPKNETAQDINMQILNMTHDSSVTYHSIDSVIPHAGDHVDIENLYPAEYLNLLNFSGLPPHQLELKTNTPVILLRNLNQTQGLCNGTRLIVTQLLPRIIEAQVMTGTATGRKVYIPRIYLTHSDKELPFVFKRKQFPIKLCYAMTINKSQGQSLDKIGIYLPQSVFSHGQLYVALSRATNPSALKVLIIPEENNKENETKNIVYSDFIKEVNGVYL